MKLITKAELLEMIEQRQAEYLDIIDGYVYAQGEDELVRAKL